MQVDGCKKKQVFCTPANKCSNQMWLSNSQSLIAPLSHNDLMLLSSDDPTQLCYRNKLLMKICCLSVGRHNCSTLYMIILYMQKCS